MKTRLERLIELARQKPDAAFPLYGLAMEHKSKDQPEEAAKSFSKLLEGHPDYIPAFLHYGLLLAELDQVDEAVELMRRGIGICREKGEDHAREELEAALGQLRPEAL